MEKNIMSEDLIRAAKNGMKSTSSIDWYGLNIVIKNTLTLQEMLLFVNSVVKTCFDEDGEYHPENKAFAMRYSTIAMYTNINIPDDVDMFYDIVYGTNLVEKVMKNVRRAQFDKIVEAIDKKIDYLVDSKIGVLNKQIDLLTSEIELIDSKFSTIFDGINNDDITKLIQSIPREGFNEEKIVKAILKENGK